MDDSLQTNDINYIHFCARVETSKKSSFRKKGTLKILNFVARRTGKCGYDYFAYPNHTLANKWQFPSHLLRHSPLLYIITGSVCGLHFFPLSHPKRRTLFHRRCARAIFPEKLHNFHGQPLKNALSTVINHVIRRVLKAVQSRAHSYFWRQGQTESSQNGKS